MYVADLVSAPTERSKGYGSQIFAYLEDTARNAGCKRCTCPWLIQSHLLCSAKAALKYVWEGVRKTCRKKLLF